MQLTKLVQNVVGTKSMQKQHQHEEPRSSGNEYTNSLVVKIIDIQSYVFFWFSIYVVVWSFIWSYGHLFGLLVFYLFGPPDLV